MVLTAAGGVQKPVRLNDVCFFVSSYARRLSRKKNKNQKNEETLLLVSLFVKGTGLLNYSSTCSVDR